MKNVESILDIEVNREALEKGDSTIHTHLTILKIAAGVEEGTNVFLLF